jgi:hypothetical protein
MYTRKSTFTLVTLFLVLLGAYIFTACGPASADEVPADDPAITDPSFRQEAPERYIECEDGSVVLLGEGGTSVCPESTGPMEPDAPPVSDSTATEEEGGYSPDAPPATDSVTFDQVAQWQWLFNVISRLFSK